MRTLPTAPALKVLPAPEDPVEGLLRTISASRLNCWHQCRLRFYFRYVDRISKPPTPALHVGSVVHGVLQAWNMARWRREPFSLDGFRDLFNQQWHDVQSQAKIRWDGEEEAQRTAAWAALELYFSVTPIQTDERPEAVEVRVEAELSRHGLPTLVGILDLVRAGGRIVDFKTAAQTPGAERALHQHESQLSCYAVLYREATGHQEGGMELHHLVKTKTPKVVVTKSNPMTELQQTRLFRAIESYQEGLSRRDFVPSPGLGCMGCEYFGECRRWSGAAKKGRHSK